MTYVHAYLVRFLQDLKGATAIEYGLIAAGISLAVSVAIFAFGGTLNDLFFTRLSDIFN